MEHHPLATEHEVPAPTVRTRAAWGPQRAATATIVGRHDDPAEREADVAADAAIAALRKGDEATAAGPLATPLDATRIRARSLPNPPGDGAATVPTPRIRPSAIAYRALQRTNQEIRRSFDHAVDTLQPRLFGVGELPWPADDQRRIAFGELVRALRGYRTLVPLASSTSTKPLDEQLGEGEDLGFGLFALETRPTELAPERARPEDQPQARVHLDAVVRAAERLRDALRHAPEGPVRLVSDIELVPSGIEVVGKPIALVTPERWTSNLDALIADGYKELSRLLHGPLAAERAGRHVTARQPLDRYEPSQLIVRYEHFRDGLDKHATALASLGGLAESAITQPVEARGDMYHVKPVLGLFPTLHVVIYGLSPMDGLSIATVEERGEAEVRLAEWGQALALAEFYGNKQRVHILTPRKLSGDEKAESVRADSGAEYTYWKDVKNAKENGTAMPKKARIGVGGCTTLIGLAAGELGTAKLIATMAGSIAPDPVGDDADPNRVTRVEMQAILADRGFLPNVRYLIVNHRASGHKNIEGKLAAAGDDPERRREVIERYDPSAPTDEGNHPELDTGHAGVRQLAQLAREMGFVPVFMGDEPAEAKDQRPNLFKYWEWTTLDGKKRVRTGGRTGEAFVLRVLAETYTVRALAMRSGVTDQMAFLGIPVVSIDLDTFHRSPAPPIFGSKSGAEGTEKNQDAADSWARGSKLEAGFGRDYGRVFLRDERNLKQFMTGDTDAGKWSGEFSYDDLAAIRDAIGFYFKGQGRGLRHDSHPLNPYRVDPLVSVFPSRALRLAGKLDTNLNPDAVLLDLRLVLTPRPDEQAAPRHELDRAVDILGAHVRAVRALLEWTEEDRATVDEAREGIAKVKLSRHNAVTQLLGRAAGLCPLPYWTATVARYSDDIRTVAAEPPAQPAPQPVPQ